MFKQSKLSWVVHHSELVEQSLDHLSHPCLGAYMQVFGCVSGEVERCPPSQPSALLSLTLPAELALVWGEGDRSDQVKMDLDETRVGPVFILKVTQLNVKEKPIAVCLQR